jgi:hypothetical protein
MPVGTVIRLQAKRSNYELEQDVYRHIIQPAMGPT